MPNQTYQSIIVTGINSGSSDDLEPVVQARVKALELFDPELVSELTPIGHNFVQSFCVFPSGSGNQREPQMEHQRGVAEFCTWLEQRRDHLDYVAVKWSDDVLLPVITHSHEGGS